MTVTVVFAGAADNDISCNDVTYLTARNGGGAFTGPPSTLAAELWNGQLNFGTYTVWQAFIDFPLTAVAAGQVVTSAVMQTWLVTDNSASDFLCVAIGYDWGAAVTSADWRTVAQHAGQTWWANIATSGIGATGAYKSWSDGPEFQDLITALAGTEINLTLATDQMVAGNAPPAAQYVVWSSSDVAGTTQDPKLTITHAHDLLVQADDTGMLAGGAGDGVEFYSPPEAAVDADVVFRWDLDNDGDFSEAVENQTARVKAVDLETGRDFPSGLTGETKPGQAKVVMVNEDDYLNQFNTASPLATAPFSLRTGRKVRIETSDAVADDPVLLARDLFQRADGSLGTSDTGQAWTNNAGSFIVRSSVAAAGPTWGGDNVATLDVGTTDMFVQATLRQLPAPDSARFVGLMGRYLDSTHYTRVRFNPGLRNVAIADWPGGVFTTIASASNIDGYEGMVLGLSIVGNLATAYVDGVAVCSAVSTRAQDGTRAGLFSIYTQYTGRSPELGDFHVWDHVAEEVPGILWTGDGSDLAVSVDVLGTKLATLTADGPLVRAATAEVAAPRLPIGGATTGLLVGDVLHRAGLLHPPTPLDAGAVRTGPVGIDDGKAIDLARMFEDTEQGTIVEAPEGGVTFQSSTARATAPMMAWFSDTPGVGQYPFHRIEPVDRRSQLINRITAGVAAEPPVLISVARPAGNQHVDLTMPTVEEGDLLIVAVADSHDGQQDWLNPLWWESQRDLKGANGMRVYTHPCNGTEDGTVIRFRQWDGSEAGLWIANIYLIRNWYGTHEGLKVSDFVSGNDPGAMVHGWGRYPTMFVTFVTGIRAVVDMAFSTSFEPPDGYDYVSGAGGIQTAATNAYEVGILSAYKIDVTDSENATMFEGIQNALINESVVVAIRGFNGPHTKGTLEDPSTVGGEGRFVTVDNVTSQGDYNATLSHRSPSNLFATEADAQDYGESVTTAYGDERPILTLSFWASKSASLRALRVALRVGHRVFVTSSGATGLGVERAFHVEAIGDKISQGGKLWEVFLSLSPA